MMIVNVRPRTRGIRFYNPVLEGFVRDVLRESAPVKTVAKATPSVNVLETADHFKIEVAAPGFDKADFNVSTEKDVLTIAANKASNDETNGTLRRKEFTYNNFERTFRLPDTIEVDAIDASYNNGILNVILPKKEAAKEKPAKKIEIA
ncbi:MAG: Hsp20/alpha crystallin family protein [Saprospiraceae bacterium]